MNCTGERANRVKLNGPTGIASFLHVAELQVLAYGMCFSYNCSFISSSILYFFVFIFFKWPTKLKGIYKFNVMVVIYRTLVLCSILEIPTSVALL